MIKENNETRCNKYFCLTRNIKKEQKTATAQHGHGKFDLI